MKYIKKPDVYECFQWTGHGCESTIEEIVVDRMIGTSGYQAKLGYIRKGEDSFINAITVRPSDYVVKQPSGQIKLIAKSDFEKEFCSLDEGLDLFKKLANTRKAGTRKRAEKIVVQDNVEVI